MLMSSPVEAPRVDTEMFRSCIEGSERSCLSSSERDHSSRRYFVPVLDPGREFGTGHVGDAVSLERILSVVEGEVVLKVAGTESRPSNSGENQGTIRC